MISQHRRLLANIWKPTHAMVQSNGYWQIPLENAEDNSAFATPAGLLIRKPEEYRTERLSQRRCLLLHRLYHGSTYLEQRLPSSLRGVFSRQKRVEFRFKAAEVPFP
ncbi:hypothetical protein COOONC_28471 [Cooperia oncophora]